MPIIRLVYNCPGTVTLKISLEHWRNTELSWDWTRMSEAVITMKRKVYESEVIVIMQSNDTGAWKEASDMCMRVCVCLELIILD